MKHAPAFSSPDQKKWLCRCFIFSFQHLPSLLWDAGTILKGDSSTQGPTWVTSCFLSASLAAVVDRNMDTAFASNSPSRALSQRLSLLSDCCNDNPRPVICTLQLPSSTSACIFNPLRRPWPDSHLRREVLPLLGIYSPITVHRSSPLSGSRREEASTLIVNTF